MAKSILFSSVTLFFIIPFAGAIGPTYWTYMPNVLDIYAQRVGHIYPTHWIYIADTLDLYIQQVRI